MEGAGGVSVAAVAAPSGDGAVSATTQVAEATTATETAAKEATAEDTTEAKAEEVAEAKPKRKGSKDWAKENLDLDSASDDEAGDFVRELAGNSHKLNKQLGEMFDINPEVGAAISRSVKDGENFWVALAEFVSPEDYARMIEDSEGGKEALAKNKVTAAERKAFEAQVVKNKVTSEKALTSIMAKHSLAPEAVTDLFNTTILPIMKNLVNQNFDEAMFEKFIQLHNYKQDVADAGKLASAKALNSKDKMAKDKSDGLPQLNGGGGAAKAAETVIKKMSSLSGIAAENDAMRRKL